MRHHKILKIVVNHFHAPLVVCLEMLEGTPLTKGNRYAQAAAVHGNRSGDRSVSGMVHRGKRSPGAERRATASGPQCSADERKRSGRPAGSASSRIAREPHLG